MGAQRSLKEKLWSYRVVILALTLLLGGVLLDVFHSHMARPELVRDLAIALLIAGTMGLGLELYTRKQFLDDVSEILEKVILSSPLGSRLDDLRDIVMAGIDLRSLGVKRLEANRRALDFADILKQAAPESEIKILGICLMSLDEPRIQHILEDKLRAGCSIKILLLDPDSRAVEERATDERRKYTNVRGEIEASENIHRVFVEEMRPKSLRGNIELGYYDRYPGYFLLAIHSLVVVGFYLRDYRGEDSPHMELEVKAGGLSEPFLRHFDAAWKGRKVVLGLELPFRPS